MSSMMQSMLLCFVLCVAGARAQPTACSEEAHCPSGFYCETELHFCRECLHCEDLKRDPPQVTTSCVRSVSECGHCSKGLVDDRGGDASAGCVPADARAGAGAEPGGARDAHGLPAYAWAMIGCFLALFVFGFVVLVYMLRNTDIIKFTASTRTSTCVTNGAASAPEPPPPYNTHYAPPPPPVLHPHPADDYHASGEDASWPLVKRAPTPAPPPGAAREAAGRQVTIPFSNPVYVRGGQLGDPTHEDWMRDVEPSPERSSAVVDHDEETMESIWRPGDSANNNDATISNGAPVTSFAGVLPAASTPPPAPAPAAAPRRAARPDQLAQPPSKVLRLRQDNNNNRNRDGGGDEAGGEARPQLAAPSGAAVYISVTNVSNVQQVNHMV